MGQYGQLVFGNNNRLYYLTPSGLNYYDLKIGSYPVAGENIYPFFQIFHLDLDQK